MFFSAFGCYLVTLQSMLGIRSWEPEVLEGATAMLGKYAFESEGLEGYG